MGATLGIDPFSPEAGNHGAKYQWGTTTGEPDRYLSQYEDQSTPEYNSWSQAAKPNGSWSDTSKTQNDPCPSGYRVPTIAQWGALLENNPNIERIGTFDDDNNYTTAIYFRNENNIRTLMLPIAGWRFAASGHLIDRGKIGYYWSSTEKDDMAVFAMLEKDNVSLKIFNRSSGNSVRCIAQ
ncbi:FISUMP domain-containing protein [Elizabethkingia anophelis]|uniref:FISUMP domain-containing protein n=1 Tax=Elizabethkingia anophelis TaxID=1117645 RepID=UPI0021A85D84